MSGAPPPPLREGEAAEALLEAPLLDPSVPSLTSVPSEPRSLSTPPEALVEKDAPLSMPTSPLAASEASDGSSGSTCNSNVSCSNADGRNVSGGATSESLASTNLSGEEIIPVEQAAPKRIASTSTSETSPCKASTASPKDDPKDPLLASRPTPPATIESADALAASAPAATAAHMSMWRTPSPRSHTADDEELSDFDAHGPSSSGNSFRRVMDIGELVRMGSRSRPDAEESEGQGLHQLDSVSAIEPSMVAAAAGAEPEVESTATAATAIQGDEPATESRVPEVTREAKGKEIEETEREAQGTAEMYAASHDTATATKPHHSSRDFPPIPPACHPIHEPPSAPTPVVSSQPPPPSTPLGALRPPCTNPRFTDETLRLRRTLLSALPAPLRRLYSLELRPAAARREAETAIDGTAVGNMEMDTSASTLAEPSETEHAGAPPVLVPADVVEGDSPAHVFSAAARAESALRRMHGHNLHRSTLPVVPKALPLLLDHLCEDAYYVHGAWSRYHDDVQFIKGGATVAVRKRRRVSLLGPGNAKDSCAPLRTPRTQMAMRNWMPDAEDAARAFHRRLNSRSPTAVLALAPAGQSQVPVQQQQPQGQASAVSTAAAGATSSRRHGPSHKRGVPAIGASNEATATVVAVTAADDSSTLADSSEDAVTAADVLSPEETAMYARYAMSSGKLRQEVGEPFAVLTRRAAQLREAVLRREQSELRVHRFV